jgi:signal transduction histidine kinase
MGACILDCRSGMVNVSGGMLQLLGMDRETLPIDDLCARILKQIDPEDRGELSAAFSGLRSGRSMLNIECRLMESREVVRHFHWCSKPGPENGYVTICVQDISNRKLLERTLQSKKLELEKANTYFDKFVRTTTHDLRAPIANLKQIASLLLMMDKDDDPVFKMLDASVERIDQTVSGFIKMIDEQKVEGDQLKTVSFSEKSNLVLAALGGLIQKTNAFILEDFQVKQIYYVDPYLESILRNLIQNALKYADADRRPFIKLSTTLEAGFVVLSIQDNGIGINLDEAGKRLFRPFKRFTDQGSGYGIGLHLVKSMAEKNGGRIEVNSEPNRGSLFKIYLNSYQEEYSHWQQVPLSKRA